MKKRIMIVFFITLLLGSLLIPAGFARMPTTVFQQCSTYVTMQEVSLYPSERKAPPNLSTTDLPSEFSWKDYQGQDWTTPAKHQGPIGSCWDFGALAIVESMIEIRENCSHLDPDLSEQYVLSCIEGAGSAYGGNPYAALQLLIDTSSDGNNCNGIIPESCFPYQADDRIPCSDKCDTWEESLIPLVECGNWFSSGSSEDRDIIKAWMIEHGPVVAFIHASDFLKIWGAYHHDSNEYFRFYRLSPTINHVVQLVGWKDDSSIGRGGYWICKNSWGTDWGYDGFFNIEYNALNIALGNIIWVDYNPEEYNWPPVPVLEELHQGFAGNGITFDASHSYDPEGTIVSYQWDFGDGVNATGEKPVHTYSEQGSYQVVLTLQDETGKSTETTSWARIQNGDNSPPTPPEINGPSSGQVSEALTYRFSSSDPEDDELLYYVEWQDKDSTGWMGPYASQEEIQMTHTWSTIDSFELRVKAMDVYGAESDWATLEISIQKSKVGMWSTFLLRLMDFCPQAVLSMCPLIQK